MCANIQRQRERDRNLWCRQRASLAAALLGCALVAGCRVDQQAEVATYRKVIDREPMAIPFEQGKPLSLEGAMSLANQHNEALGLRGEDYLQSLIDRDRAAAAFMPTVSLVPSYYAQESSHPARDGSDRHLDVPVNGNANLFNGFSDLARYRAAGSSIAQRRAILLDAQAALLLDVAQTYYQVLVSEQTVDVLKNSLSLQEARVQDVRGKLNAGLAKTLELAQSEAQASQTRVLLLAAQNDVQNGRSVLSFLTGVAVQGCALSDDVRVPEMLPDLPALQQTARANRQDLTAAVAAVEAARQNVQAAIGQYYPSVTLNLNAFLTRESLPTESHWNALLSANLPIFTGGIIHADVRTAWSQLRQAKLSESLAQRQVVEDVELAWQTIQSTRKRVRELEIQVAAAKQASFQASESYKAGLATNLEALTAQDQLLSSELQITSQRLRLKELHLQLLRALGTLSTRLPGELSTTRPATLPAIR